MGEDAEALRKRLETILQSVGDGVLNIDADGVIRSVNPAAARLLGYNASELVGQPSGKLYPARREADLDDDSPIMATLRDGTVHHVRGGEKFARKDGKAIEIEFVSAPVTSAGKRAGAVVIFRTKSAEAALRESEERFRRLADATTEGVVLHEHGIILDANQRVAEMMGYDVKELIGKSVLDITAPEDRDAVAARVRSGADTKFETGGLRKDGSRIRVEISSRSIPFEGRTVRVGTIRDITQARKTEETATQATQRILQIYENLPDAFFALDKAWNIVYLNPVAVAMTPPANRGKYLGRNLWEMFPDLQGTKFDIEYHRAMSERVPVHVEEHFARMDRWFEASAYPSEEGLSVFFRDVTSRKKAEEVLRGASVSRPLVRKIVHDLVEAGGVAHQILQTVGRKLAAETAAKDIDGYAKAFAEMGLGDLTTEKREEGRFTFVGSDLLEHQPGSRVATCYFTLGFLSEAVSRISGGEPTLGTEIECQSRGSHKCRFIVQVKKPEEGLARRVKELV